MQAKDIMTSPVNTIMPDTTVEEAARMMINGNISCLPVIDNAKELVGIITHTDLIPKKKFLPLADHIYSILGSMVSADRIEEAAQALGSRKVEQVMTNPVITVEENTDFSAVAKLMVGKNINRLPVLRNGSVVGIITRHDLLKVLI
jgi:CBS domain-containing protein